MVVCGEKKYVEENIAKLIRFEFRIHVELIKPDIDRALNQHGSNLYLLIKMQNQVIFVKLLLI